ncbi:MAG: polysaccharide deacetylase family protein [Cyanobacteria bacterium NC_groundwater_1444_Ag_S-0.65um_54_12]|nr:polysaccharide deacetylase family protein [Cyanobacteria bacterium NC_groundwater_1444_Ag_S-0.65um_54_12]
MSKHRYLLLTVALGIVILAGGFAIFLRGGRVSTEQKPLVAASPVSPAATGSQVIGGQTVRTALATTASQANELGQVPILEYHDLGPGESRWGRSITNFRKDLEWLATNGYVSATTQDMLDGFPQLPAGRKPVVMTFDDARRSQFMAVGIDKDGLAIPSEDCAVGIMMDFAKAYPDFGHRASFYVLPSLFEEEKTLAAKLRYLVNHDFEIGNHTWSHLTMGKATPAQIANELTRLQGLLQQTLGSNFHTTTIALPNGSVPKSPAQLAAALGGTPAPYHHSALLLVGANPAHSPFTKAYNPLRLARIQAIDSEWQRWFGRSPGHVGKSAESFSPYVADGDPKMVSFPVKLKDSLAPNSLRGAAPRIITEGDNVPQAAEPTSSTKYAAAVKESSTSALPAASSTESLPASASLASHPAYGEPLPSGGNFRDGRIFHVVQSGQSFESLSHKYLRYTDAYTARELREQITRLNHLRHPWVDVGQTIEIPGVRLLRPQPKPDRVAANFVAKGIYCTSTTASFERIFKLAKELKAVGGNTVIFDVKDGPIAFLAKDAKVRALSEWDHTITDLPKLVERLHASGIHVAARQVLFNDPVLAKKRPDLAIHSKRNPGKVWLEHGKLRWVDPSQPEVQDYNLRLAKELAQSGVDEIQFDYVRFPAQGDTRDCRYTFDETKLAKHEVITGFLRRAREELAPHGMLISIDVYGVIAWNKDIDQRITGQKLEDMAKYVDVICPMVYPSHFYPPFDGFNYPADQPYYFVSQGVERLRQLVGPDCPTIRPWLQAFPYMVSRFSSTYVAKQLQAARDAKALGWQLWNASNKYDIGFAGVANWNDLVAATPPKTVYIKGSEAARAKLAKVQAKVSTSTIPTTMR